MTSNNNNSFCIGLLGSVDVCKSSLLGVLKSNKLDDCRGSSRKNILYYHQEIKSGRTSSFTPYYIDMDDSLITIVDLAGHATIHSGTVIQTAQFSEIINIKPNKKKLLMIIIIIIIIIMM